MGAQNILSQFFSGIILLSTRPFRKGDFIKINNTVYIIKKVKLMFTELYTWEKDQVVTMPNNTLTSATIVNVTRETPEFRVYVYMTIAYEADLAKAKELMTKAGMEHPHAVVDGSRTVPSVRLTDFQDSGIELRLAVYVDNFDDSGTYAGELRERIFQLFKENDIEIPYTKYEITLKNCDGRNRPGDELD
jgi:small-conductance mechanosensitive channel